MIKTTRSTDDHDLISKITTDYAFIARMTDY